MFLSHAMYILSEAVVVAAALKRSILRFETLSCVSYGAAWRTLTSPATKRNTRFSRTSWRYRNNCVLLLDINPIVNVLLCRRRCAAWLT